MSDDSGIFTDGTIVNKAFVDQVYDQVDDQCHSTTNPTIKPKAITDEVVTARGSMASLDARLDVALEEDGTPKAVAGQATETQLARAEANFNLIKNSDLEDWTSGTTSAPDNYSLSGVGAAILKSGPAQGDTTDLGTGTYCARITSGAGAAAKLTQEVISTANYSKYRSVDGRKVGFTIRAKVANSNVLRIVVDDGVTTTVGSYATGSASEQDLSVVHTISASATKLDVYAEVALGAGVAYVGGFTVAFSDLAPAAWTPLWAKFINDLVPSTADVNNLGTTTVNLGGRLSTNVSDVGNVGAGEDDLMTYALPAGALASDGQVVRVIFWGTMAANGNVKRLRAYFGATSIEMTVAGHAPNDAKWSGSFYIVRTGAATQILFGDMRERDAAATSFNFVPAEATPAETLSGAVTIKMTGEATSNNDIVQKGMIVEILP